MGPLRRRRRAPQPPAQAYIHINTVSEREMARRREAQAERDALIASLVADYYRADVAVEERGAGEFRHAQFGIMRHAVTVLSRITGVDSLTVGFRLEAGMPVADEPKLEGTREERLRALRSPYLMTNAGVYSHLAVEDRGPKDGPAAAAAQRAMGITL